MTCEEVQINLPEYIDGKLDEKISGMVRTHLESCEACRSLCSGFETFLLFTGSLPEIEPPGGMKEEFFHLAHEEESHRYPERQTIFLWSKIAAVIIIAFITYAAGYLAGSGKNKSHVEQLAKELDLQKQEVSLASLRDHTGPQKIEAVYDISASGKAGNDLIDALVYTMNSDDNVNVRLAAINALAGMVTKNQRVKSELIRSLSLQENPLLQISLIQVLTDSRVQEAKKAIESISKSDDADESVKAFAKNMVKKI